MFFVMGFIAGCSISLIIRGIKIKDRWLIAASAGSLILSSLYLFLNV